LLILKAVAIEQSSLLGGSTLPSLMRVKDESGKSYNYVVKIFKSDYLAATCREVFAHALASEFDLQVPQAALIEVNQEIIHKLKELPKFNDRNIRAGYYFGTEFLTEAQIYTNNLSFVQISDWDMLRIFSFDVLIRNADRRVAKPNFLLYENEPILIDHELSLGFFEKNYNDFNVSDWGFLYGGGSKSHIFLDILREKSKNNLIDLAYIQDYLRTFKPNILFSYAEQLLRYDYDDAGSVVKIICYLDIVKNNPQLFI
jgi:hypothetical protein